MVNMLFHEKLFELRKKEELTQAELAEALHVSRQAVSKWEMGTAFPDVENLLLLSKFFSVSVDYLVNEDMNSDLDAPAVKATAAILKMNYQYIIVRIIIAFSVIAIIAILGNVFDSPATSMTILIAIGLILVIYILGKWIIKFFLKRKK